MMRRSVLSALLFCFIAAPATASAVQVVLADTDVAHTQASGAYVSIGAVGAPADFTAPANYAQGMLHHRVQVTTAPTNATSYKVCFVQGANTACSNNAITINGAGTFETTQALSGFTNYAMIAWDMPLDDIEVVAMDSAGVAVDASETTWIGSPDYGLYYPLDLTYQAVLVASGDAFEGYPGDQPGNAAEAPTMSPNGGTYEGSVSVSLASDTMDAMIYYTTDGSAPDDSSTLYDGTPISITTTTTVRAVAYAAGLDPSPETSATFTIVAMLSNGLRGRYFDTDDFQGLQMTRTDPVIDFTFADGAPPSPDLGGTYSILWTGQVTPRYTDTYTFKTVNDDGVRLWVNDQLVIDDWNYHGPQERTGTIALTANQPATIWLEYFNGGGGGQIRLSWESPQQSDEVIPDSAMVPNLPAGQQPVLSLIGPGEDSYPESYTEPITFELRRRGNLDAVVVPTLEFGGTATYNEDYTGVNRAQFAAGEMSKTITVNLTNDMLVEEAEETLSLTLLDGDGYVVGPPATREFVILDDDVLVDSIQGTITYTGTESGKIIVEAFRETDPVYAKRRVSLLNPGPYQLLDLEEGAYTVIAYIDSDDDEQLDSETEIWGVYQGADLQPAFVTIPPGQTGIDINLDVPPGEAGGDGDGDGCCATVARGPASGAGWLALLLGAMVVALRRRR